MAETFVWSTTDSLSLLFNDLDLYLTWLLNGSISKKVGVLYYFLPEFSHSCRNPELTLRLLWRMAAHSDLTKWMFKESERPPGEKTVQQRTEKRRRSVLLAAFLSSCPFRVYSFMNALGLIWLLLQIQIPHLSPALANLWHSSSVH